MFESGATVRMTKGYRGLRGEILEKTESSYDLYVVELENGIRLVAGPNAFEAATPANADS